MQAIKSGCAKKKKGRRGQMRQIIGPVPLLAGAVGCDDAMLSIVAESQACFPAPRTANCWAIIDPVPCSA